jgi:hypothetical protein
MSARLERILRAYRPLYLRGTLIEGGGRPAVPAAEQGPPKPARLSLFAWVALVLPRRGRGKP